MTRVLGVLKSTYYFFSGDPILLSGVLVAFVAAYVVGRTVPTSARQLVAGLVLVAVILLSLTVTLRRERGSRPRQA
jgi:asparagine N-glycosylation enzyme membrane subunit Stt3